MKSTTRPPSIVPTRPVQSNPQQLSAIHYGIPEGRYHRHLIETIKLLSDGTKPTSQNKKDPPPSSAFQPPLLIHSISRFPRHEPRLPRAHGTPPSPPRILLFSRRCLPFCSRPPSSGPGLGGSGGGVDLSQVTSGKGYTTTRRRARGRGGRWMKQSPPPSRPGPGFSSHPLNWVSRHARAEP